MADRFLSIALVCASMSGVGRAETLTYQFDALSDAHFRYSGGLMGGNFDARLTGSFDIERSDDGMATISRFDVFIADPQFSSPPSPLGNPTGKPLAFYLVDDPIGRPVELAGLPRDGGSIDLTPGPQLDFSLSDFDSPTAQFRFMSHYAWYHDTPAAFAHDGGITVTLLPEPSAIWLFAVAGLSVLARRRTSRFPALA